MKGLVAIVFIFMLLLSSVCLAPSIGKNHTAYALSPATITKTRSGLIASDALTSDQINTSYWHFGGDAVALQAPYDYYQNSGGLHIGVQAANSGEWAGYYGVSPASPAHLYHATLKIPFSSISDHWWDTGMYIQTTSPVINYVTCAAVVSTSGITWAVVSTKGNAYQATEFNTLWTDIGSNQPTARDCTIITNGNNLLKVFFDNQLVFSSNTLDLDMPEPFNTYLEAQTSTTSGKLYGLYSDYYATSDTAVKVVNAPVGGTVKIVDSSSNKSFGKDTVDGKGKASISIAKYHLPLSAQIKVFDSANNLIATKTVDKMWAGDVYKLSYDTATTSPAISESSNESGDKLSPDVANYGHWNKNIKIHELPPLLFQ